MFVVFERLVDEDGEVLGSAVVVKKREWIEQNCVDFLKPYLRGSKIFVKEISIDGATELGDFKTMKEKYKEKLSQPLKEGKSKGGTNSPPTTPRPSAPFGQKRKNV